MNSDPDNPEDPSSVTLPRDRTEQFVSLLSRGEFEIRAAILTICPHQADADDLWQRTSIILWRKFSQWQPGTDFVAWASQVARLEVKNFVRSRARDRLYFDAGLIDALGDARSELTDELAARRDALAQCLQKLSSADRELIIRCYADRKATFKTTAAAIGISVNTIYKALIRIRRKLLDCTQRVLTAEGRS